MLWTTDHHSAKHVKECLGGQGWGLVLLKYREDLFIVHACRASWSSCVAGFLIFAPFATLEYMSHFRVDLSIVGELERVQAFDLVVLLTHSSRLASAWWQLVFLGRLCAISTRSLASLRYFMGA